MSGAWKHLEVVKPQMPDLSELRLSVKFGRSKTNGSIYARSFYFDTAEKKYRYYKSDKPGPDLKTKKDVTKKAKNLSKCDYEINTKSNPGKFDWRDRTGRSETRLSMQFEERGKWPIFVYDEGRESVETLQGLKAYGVYCKKQAEGGEGNAEKLLHCLSYANSAFAYNKLVGVDNKVREGLERSGKLNKVVKIMSKEGEELSQQEKQLLCSWGAAVVGRIGHFRPRPTIRLALFLRSMARIRNPTDKIVMESAKKIVKYYDQHRKVANEAFDWEITEKASRRTNGISTFAHYKISPKVVSALNKGEKAVGSDFPEKSFQHSQCSAKLDYEEFKIVVGDDLDSGKIFGRMPIGDISSLVIDDAPDDIDERKRWLRINGRRIQDKILGISLPNTRK